MVQELGTWALSIGETLELHIRGLAEVNAQNSSFSSDLNGGGGWGGRGQEGTGGKGRRRSVLDRGSTERLCLWTRTVLLILLFLLH